MLDRLRQLLGELAHATPVFDPDDYRVASVALLVHVATADGAIAASERDRLSAIVESRYDLDQTAAKALLAAAEEQDHAALDLSDLTSGLRRTLDGDKRETLVAMMWDIAQADGTIHEFEESIVLRAAELLGIAPERSAALRARSPGLASTP